MIMTNITMITSLKMMGRMSTTTIVMTEVAMVIMATLTATLLKVIASIDNDADAEGVCVEDNDNIGGEDSGVIAHVKAVLVEAACDGGEDIVGHVQD